MYGDVCACKSSFRAVKNAKSSRKILSRGIRGVTKRWRRYLRNVAGQGARKETRSSRYATTWRSVAYDFFFFPANSTILRVCVWTKLKRINHLSSVNGEPLSDLLYKRRACRKGVVFMCILIVYRERNVMHLHHVRICTNES